MNKFTMAQAKRDFQMGHIKGAAVYFHNVMGSMIYTVGFQSSPDSEPVGFLVDARSSEVREFKTLDAAHSSLLQIGFNVKRFWVGAK